jgi:putative membrane protein
MSSPVHRREPRSFAPDDPAIVIEPEVERSPAAAAPGAASDTAELVRPTLADIGRRGLRWGALLATALAGATALALGAWFARFVSAALAREDWIGTLTLACLLIAAFAALMILLRELVGFSTLSRLGRLKREIAAAITEKDRRRERKAVQRLVGLYGGRSDLAWSLGRVRDHTRDVHDAGELLTLVEREVMAPLDREARGLVTRSAKRVATVTALSPIMLIAVGYVFVENIRLLRLLATLYGGRPGTLGALRLARMVFTHIVATGGIAMTDDLLGQFLGQDLLRRLSRRLGEGAFNGALTARIGVAGIDVIRPLPFVASTHPRVRDVLAEALRPLLSKAPSPAPKAPGSTG